MENITNQAHVSFTYEGNDVVKTNHSNIVNSTMKDRYSICIEKSTTNDCFRPGDTLTYFVRIINDGCGCLRNFIISDNLGQDDNLIYIEGSARIFINGSMQEIVPTNTSPLEFEVANMLERDQEFILQYSVTVNPNLSLEVLEITNTVHVQGYPCGCGCDSSNSNCVHAETSLTIEKCEFAEVLITKAISNDSVCCDDELDYFITLTNTGTIDALNVVVTDQLPTNFSATEIHMENNGNHYRFNESEYTIDEANLLTLPNETGTVILVPALAPGVDNTTRIRIHGHM